MNESKKVVSILYILMLILFFTHPQRLWGLNLKKHSSTGATYKTRERTEEVYSLYKEYVSVQYF